MEMVSKVEECVKGTDLHRPLPCWSLLGFFIDFLCFLHFFFFFTCVKDFLFFCVNKCVKDFLFFCRFFFFTCKSRFREPSKREGVRV